MKKYRLHISLVLVAFFIATGSVVADGPSVYIEVPGWRTEFCVGDKTIFIGKCTLGTDDYDNHKWNSSPSGIIKKTIEQAAVIEFEESGRYHITYEAEDLEGNIVSESITINVHDKPEAEITISEPFLSRFTGSELPKIIEAKHTKTDYEYQWYRNNEKIKDANEDKFKAEKKGLYRLVITSEKGCRGYSEAYEIK